MEQIRKTAIIVAHRLGTIREVDKIMVIGDGEIIEIGNHSDLVKKRGHYFTLLQKSG